MGTGFNERLKTSTKSVHRRQNVEAFIASTHFTDLCQIGLSVSEVAQNIFAHFLPCRPQVKMATSHVITYIFREWSLQMESSQEIQCVYMK